MHWCGVWTRYIAQGSGNIRGFCVSEQTVAAPRGVVGASAQAGSSAASGTLSSGAAGGATFAVILSLSFCHFLNDMMQSLVPALYPILKTSYGLDFAQIGLITMAFQFTASMLQPVVGIVTDRKPQ